MKAEDVMKREDFIITYSKLKFSPLEANSGDIQIIDIAHALSLMCRANGHIKHFYSVAQHSINCMLEARSRGLSGRLQLACLLHDASEAYLSDITRPVKLHLEKYREYEEVLQSTIMDRFSLGDLSEEDLMQVKAIDDSMLYHELLELMEERIFNDVPQIVSKPDFEQRDFTEIRELFLKNFEELTKRGHHAE